ncbi:MAG: hypothetical protein ABJC09_00090 [Terriglobia bacterium]
MIWAILRAQLLSMRLRKGTGRYSALFSWLTGLFFYGMWAFLAWGALLFFSEPDEAPYFIPVLSSGLMLVMLYWQLAPVISASFGASLDLRKLLAYPIPHNKLFTVEVMLRLTTCAEMMIVVGGAAIGLLRNPQYGAARSPFVAGGVVLFALTNILLSAGTRNLLERLFLRTRLKEAMFFLIIMVSVLPQILRYSNVKVPFLLRMAPSQIVWPWGAAAHLMLHARGAWAALAGLAWLVIALAFSRWQFERTIRYDESASQRSSGRRTQPSKADGVSERFFRLPGRFLPDPMAALVEKELRSFARIPRFRLIYLMSCFFGIIMLLPLLRNPAKHSFSLQIALPMLTLYGLLMLGQISFWNSFGFDRSAVQGYFCWPIRFRDVLMAKNVAVVFLLIPQIAVEALVGRVFHLPTSPARILETVVVMVITSLYWFAMGNIFSVRIPRPLDPEKMNQMSNKMQALTIFMAPFLLLPLVLAYWSRWFFGSELLFAGLMLVAAAIGAVFYWVGLDSAVTTANNRREAIVMALSRADGPLSIT